MSQSEVYGDVAEGSEQLREEFAAVGWVDLPVARHWPEFAAGGVGSARGLAGLYVAAVWGCNGQPPLLEPATVGEFATLHSTGGGDHTPPPTVLREVVTSATPNPSRQ